MTCLNVCLLKLLRAKAMATHFNQGFASRPDIWGAGAECFKNNSEKVCFICLRFGI